MTKAHRKPKTLAGYRSLLDTIVLPQWGDLPLKRIDHAAYTTWLGSLSGDGSQRGTALSASRITQAHQLVGAVLKYAQKTGKLAENVALELERSKDLPQPTERKRRYLAHEELLKLARATGRFETLTLVLGYCGLRFGQAAALRRKHVGDRGADDPVLSHTCHRPGHCGNHEWKTKRARQVPVPGPVWERLKAQLPEDPNSLVFPRQPAAGYCPLRSTGGSSTGRVRQSASRVWFHTGCITPRLSWRSARALMSRLCNACSATPQRP